MKINSIILVLIALLFTGCASPITNDNSEALLNSERIIWLSDNLSTNEFQVFADYMEEEVIPTVIQLEKKVDKYR